MALLACARGTGAADVEVAPFAGIQFPGYVNSTGTGRSSSIGIGLDYGATLDILAPAQQAGASTASPGVRVHHLIVPTTPEVIESGETLVLEPWVNPGGDAFCGATVNYETVG